MRRAHLHAASLLERHAFLERFGQVCVAHARARGRRARRDRRHAALFAALQQALLETRDLQTVAARVLQTCSPPRSPSAAALLTSVHDVFPRGDAHSELRRVHPVTLAPAGAPVRLDGFLRGGYARSPDGRRLALRRRAGGACRSWPAAPRGSCGPGTGPRTGCSRGRGRTGSSRSDTSAKSPRRSWSSTRRAGACCASAQLTGRVAAGDVDARRPRAARLAPAAIADATLALIDADGDERRIALPGVPAGLRAAGEDGVARAVTPDLAVRDGARTSRPTSRVVEVDLADRRAARARARQPRARGQAARTAPSGSIAVRRPAHARGLGETSASGWPGRPAGRRHADLGRDGRIAGGARGSVALPGGGLAAWPSDRGLALLRRRRPSAR